MPRGVKFPDLRRKSGRGERIRTSDLLLPKQSRYQAALRPDFAISELGKLPVDSQIARPLRQSAFLG